MSFRNTGRTTTEKVLAAVAAFLFLSGVVLFVMLIAFWAELRLGRINL